VETMQILKVKTDDMYKVFYKKPAVLRENVPYLNYIKIAQRMLYSKLNVCGGNGEGIFF
jgi:hypothetical protein